MRWSTFPQSRALTAFAAALPMRRLHPAVVAWAGQQPPAERWAIAFSGGADSLALLLAVWAHWPTRRSRLVALHFNHRLRGRAASQDEAFCRRVCTALGIKLRVGAWIRGKGNLSEATARAARFEFFDRVMSAQKIRALWLGHQQDDIAESMLMRLARGSGLAGLAAPRPVHRFGRNKHVHVRPLLTLSKAEIVDLLSALGIPWREDATNRTGDFLRNRVRKKVIPAWRAASMDRDALAGAALSRELIEEDDAALDAWLNELMPGRAHRKLDLAPLKGKPRGLVRRALRRWLSAQRDAGKLSRQAFSTLLDSVQRGDATRQSVGTNRFAVLSRNELRFE